MKKFFYGLLICLSILLTSCGDNSILVINTVINDNSTLHASSLSNQYQEASLSTCLIVLSDVDEKGRNIDYFNSGTIVKKENDDYYIVSFYETGDLDDNVKTYFTSTDFYSGKIVGIDSKNQLCLVKVTIPNGKYKVPAFSEECQKGQQVFTVSTHTSIKNINSITRGYLSLEKSYLLYTDAPINPASYGGGLYNTNGELMAILISKDNTNLDFSDPLYIQGMSHAINIKYAMESVYDMLKDGIVRRTTLGVTLTNHFPGGESEFDYPNDEQVWVVVSQIDKMSNASRGGMKVGDIIIGAHGREVYSHADVSISIRFSKVGDLLIYSVLRQNVLTEEFEEILLYISLD